MARADREQPELMSKPAACRRAGIGARQLAVAIEGGDVPQFKIGGWPRVRWRDVVAWIESTRVPPSALTDSSLP
jgi:hypothetical protein